MSRLNCLHAAILVAATVFMPIATPSLADPAAVIEVNELRAKKGRKPLVYSAALEKIAQAHANDMANRQVMTHDSANGDGPGARARKAGYRWCRIAENVAKGQRDLAQVMQSWENSPPHRKNMLDRKVAEFGLARAGDNYWTMVLAKPGCR